MLSTEARYFLRLESGERSGETIPIPRAGLTIGRRPDNQLQISESSISGRHAELVVDDRGVTLRDLGSTNGTKVGGERISERRLAHGDDVHFGTQRAVFVDGELAARAPAAPAPAADEAVRTLAPGRAAPAGRRGLLGLFLVLALAGAATAGALLLRNRLGGPSEDGGGGAVIPVVPVAGNLVADPSFEEVDAPLAWEAADAAPAAFGRGTAFRRAGSAGLGVELGPGGWARASSPEVTVHARRSLALRAGLAVEGASQACVGVELSSSEASRPSFVAWTAPQREGDGFADVELRVPPLPGYDRARAVVEARGGDGAVSLDDVSLVEEQAEPEPAARFEEDRIYLIGEPARTAVLVHAAEVALSGLRLREAPAGEGLPRWSGGTLAVSSTPNGARIDLAPDGPGADLLVGLHLDDGALIATTGPEGFRAYSSSFESARATSLLLGQGGRLARLAFPGETALTGTLSDGTLRVEAAVGGATRVDLQLSFREERQQAALLATEAREAGKAKEVGKALAAWSRLLDEYPFESALVAEAEREKARLLQEGHAALGALREDFERARFFGLADLYRRSAAETAALGERYANSEVEAEARELSAEIAAELARQDQGDQAFERARLEAILGVVEGEGWKGLSELVRGALQDHGGG
jgi:hypothetical protein